MVNSNQTVNIRLGGAGPATACGEEDTEGV
jgi:hypothetical protein